MKTSPLTSSPSSLIIKIRWHWLFVRCLILLVLAPFFVLGAAGVGIGAFGTSSLALFYGSMRWIGARIPASRKQIAVD